MSHMQLMIYAKGALYSADCVRCGCTMFSHEWVHDDYNERRDAMEAGTLRCDECSTGTADPETFRRVPSKQYAGRYSAPGYLDCTDFHFRSNRRELVRELRDMYGDEE